MHCRAALRELSPAAEGPPLAVLTYATVLPVDWLLGTSAARARVPLVLVGLGDAHDRSRLFTDKYTALLRAARALAQAWPTTALVLADAWDVVIANPLDRVSAAARHAVDSVRRSEHVLLSTECNSWPRCYRGLFEADPGLSRCLKRAGHTCFANGGLWMGSARTLASAMIPELLGRMGTPLRHVDCTRDYGRPCRIEHAYDQAVLNRMLLARAELRAAPPPAAISLHTDSRSSVFLSLFTCVGPLTFRRLGGIGAEYCHVANHTPLERIRVTADGLAYRPLDDESPRGEATRGEATRGEATRGAERPLFVHANGHLEAGRRLSLPVFAPLRQSLARLSADELRAPVLLVGGGDRGAACNLTRLDDLRRRAGSKCRASIACNAKMGAG